MIGEVGFFLFVFFLMYGKIKEMQNSHTNEFNLAARSTEVQKQA